MSTDVALRYIAMLFPGTERVDMWGTVATAGDSLIDTMTQ
jgi:hypothetical protein